MRMFGDKMTNVGFQNLELRWGIGNRHHFWCTADTFTRTLVPRVRASRTLGHSVSRDGNETICLASAVH